MTEQLTLDNIPDEPEDWHAWIEWLANPVNNPQMRKGGDAHADKPDPRLSSDHFRTSDMSALGCDEGALT